MPTFIKQSNLNWLTVILFIPLVLSFTLPLLFYRLPLKYKYLNESIEFSSGDIFYATMVWVVWVGIAVTTLQLLSRIRNSTGSERPWGPLTLWRGFIALAVVGVLISPLQYFFSFNSGIEQLLQQLSFAPVVVVVVGIRVMQDINAPCKKYRLLRLLVGIFLISLNTAIAIGLPLLMGKAAPGVYASMAILYGLHALKIERKKQIALWLVFASFAGLALAFKSNFRTSYLGSLFWYQGTYIRIPITDVLNVGIKEAYNKSLIEKMYSHNQKTFEESPLRSQTDSISIVVDKSQSSDDYFYLHPLEYKNYDPNYNNNRFFSPDDNIPEKAKYLVAKTIGRVNHLLELANAIRLTPSSITYLNGTTYYPLLFKPIPRIFWKDKPEDNSGQVYGHRYGLLHSSDNTTSANMGVVIEAWINGGWTVVALSGFAFGVLLFLVWRYLIGESGEIGNIVLGTVFVASGLATESSMNLLMGGMLYSLLIWWVMEHIIRTKL